MCGNPVKVLQNFIYSGSLQFSNNSTTQQFNLSDCPPQNEIRPTIITSLTFVSRATITQAPPSGIRLAVQLRRSGIVTLALPHSHSSHQLWQHHLLLPAFHYLTTPTRLLKKRQATPKEHKFFPLSEELEFVQLCEAGIAHSVVVKGMEVLQLTSTKDKYHEAASATPHTSNLFVHRSSYSQLDNMVDMLIFGVEDSMQCRKPISSGVTQEHALSL